jgi:sec-independent protein translocase protein TatA
MPFGIGPLELIIVLVIVLVIFGPKRLPGLGRSLGSGMREFKDSLSGKDGDAEKDRAAAKPDGIERTADPSASKDAEDAKDDAAEEKVFGDRRS